MHTETESDIEHKKNPTGGDLLYHKINKLIWGGNRTDEDLGLGYFFIDDIIIDDAPIAERYFNIINEVPAPSTGTLDSGNGNIKQGTGTIAQ